jgi:DUF971 family protein
MAIDPVPKSLKNDGQALIIEWNDGVTHRLPWKLLRDCCPCATCNAQRNAPAAPKPLFQVLAPAEARPLAPVSVRPAGNYAYAIAFSDGHNTGIYSLEFLRELGEAAAADVTSRRPESS